MQRIPKLYIFSPALAAAAIALPQAGAQAAEAD